MINMKHLERSMIILTTTEPKFIVDHRIIRHLQRLFELKGIVLWDYEGSWGLVTADQVAELIRLWVEFKKVSRQYPHLGNQSNKSVLHFTNTIPVPTVIAKAIRG